MGRHVAARGAVTVVDGTLVDLAHRVSVSTITPARRVSRLLRVIDYLHVSPLRECSDPRFGGHSRA